MPILHRMEWKEGETNHGREARKLISGLTNDEDTVYNKAMSDGLVGARSVTIQRSQENLKYLATEIEVEHIKLTGSESADFNAQSSTSGDSGIQYASSRSTCTNTDSHPRLGADGSNPHYSQHATQKFASHPHTTQSQSSVDSEEEIQKHALHQEPIPVAETSSPSKSVEDEYQKGNKDVLLASDTGSYTVAEDFSSMVPSSESVENEDQEKEERVQLATDRGSFHPTVFSNDICSEVLKRMLRKKEVESQLKELEKWWKRELDHVYNLLLFLCFVGCVFLVLYLVLILLCFVFIFIKK